MESAPDPPDLLRPPEDLLPPELRDSEVAAQNFRCRLESMKKVPFFDECSEHHLALLAQNAQELDFRFGDEILQIGEVPSGCFIVSEGFCKISVPAEIEKRPGSNASSRELSQRFGAWQPHSSEGVEKLPPTPRGAAMAAVRCRPPRGGRRGSAAFAGQGRKPGPPTPDGPRKPGTPRPRTSWAGSLRAGNVSCWMGGPATKELDRGYILPGQAVGIGALYDSRGECPYAASVSMRVDSNSARILVLTIKSLMYLPDKVSADVIQKCREAIDPVLPPPEILEEERKQSREWAKLKRKLLRQEMTTVA